MEQIITPSGWLKLHRSILEWEWYSDANVFRVFMHLLLTAAHEDKKWRGVNIEPGQVITTYSSLSAKTGLTIQQARRAISNLQSTHEITKVATADYTVITICNWAQFQAANTQNNKQTTN